MSYSKLSNTNGTSISQNKLCSFAKTLILLKKTTIDY